MRLDIDPQQRTDLTRASTRFETTRAAGDQTAVAALLSTCRSAVDAEISVLQEFGFTAHSWRWWVVSGGTLPPSADEPEHPGERYDITDWEEFPTVAADRPRWESFGFSPICAILWLTEGLPVPPVPIEDR